METILMKNSKDLYIVKQFLQGNKEIEKKLYEEFKRIIHSLIYKIESKGCYFADKEDVVSEILFKIMAADNCKILRNYKGKSKLSTYLWPIVKNKIAIKILFNNSILLQSSPEDVFDTENDRIPVEGRLCMALVWKIVHLHDANLFITPSVEDGLELRIELQTGNGE